MLTKKKKAVNNKYGILPLMELIKRRALIKHSTQEPIDSTILKNKLLLILCFNLLIFLVPPSYISHDKSDIRKALVRSLAQHYTLLVFHTYFGNTISSIYSSYKSSCCNSCNSLKYLRTSSLNKTSNKSALNEPLKK